MAERNADDRVRIKALCDIGYGNGLAQMEGAVRSTSAEGAFGLVASGAAEACEWDAATEKEYQRFLARRNRARRREQAA